LDESEFILRKEVLPSFKQRFIKDKFDFFLFMLAYPAAKLRGMRSRNSKLYSPCFNGFRHLHKADNEKHFKEPRTKSGSNHLGIKPFFNSAILLISLLCSMIVVFEITVNIFKTNILTKKLCCFFLLYLVTFQHFRELRNFSYTYKVLAENEQ